MASESTIKKALLVGTYSNRSSYKLGTHHLCDALLRKGWSVTYVTHPLTPLNLFGHPEERALRIANIRAARSGVSATFKEYTRLQALMPVNRAWLLPGLAARVAPSCGWPSVRGIIEQRQLRGVDLLYMDNMFQPFWLDAVEPRRFVYRLPDHPAVYGALLPTIAAMLRGLLERADVTLCPTAATEGAARSMGAARTYRMPNGVDLELFRAVGSPPPEYTGLPRPIAVYLGAVDRRVDVELLTGVARKRPDMSFVVIGDLRRPLPDRPANVLLLGTRPYASIPAYLQHADVGLLPFDLAGAPDLVSGTDPLKLYQYLAAGLPVVATELPAVLPFGDTVLIAAQDPASFAQALERACIERPRLPEERRCELSWASRFDPLLADLGLAS